MAWYDTSAETSGANSEEFPVTYEMDALVVFRSVQTAAAFASGASHGLPRHACARRAPRSSDFVAVVLPALSASRAPARPERLEFTTATCAFALITRTDPVALYVTVASASAPPPTHAHTARPPRSYVRLHRAQLQRHDGRVGQRRELVDNASYRRHRNRQADSVVHGRVRVDHHLPHDAPDVDHEFPGGHERRAAHGEREVDRRVRDALRARRTPPPRFTRARRPQCLTQRLFDSSQPLRAP